MIRSLLTAVAVSLFAFPSFAQDGCTSVGCGASGCAETGCGEATPAPPWMGDLSTRAALTGDWGGLRSSLAESGVTFTGNTTQFFFGNVDGGADTGWRWGGHNDYTLNIDMDKAIGLKGNLLKIKAEHRYGRDVNPLAARVPQIEAAEARLASAEANKQTAELALRRTRVYAPLDARVLQSSLDVGQTVSPGQAVGRIVSLDRLELAVPVSQEQLALLAPVRGRQATYEIRGNAAAMGTAEVVRLDASLNARTRLSNLFLRPQDATGLLIGDFVDVTLAADPVESAHIIPATAMIGQSALWVMQDGRLAQRDITVLGERNQGLEIVVAPFDIADGVIALPPLEAVEGQPIEAREIATYASAGEGRSNGGQ